MRSVSSGARSAPGSGARAPAPPTGSKRLLHAAGEPGAPVGLDGHLECWGALPGWTGTAFIDELDRSGLRGHGGAWFPVGAKWRSVGRSGLRSPIVVANGAEGEPASGKDRFLLRQVPHLVLDGAALAATSIGASRIVMHVPAAAASTLTDAVEERRRRHIDPCPIELVASPDRFLAGQESAAVNTINGRSAVPSFTGIRSVRESGVGGRPTLVQNVESLAHVALIARFGADWFRQAGTEQSPGTALLTVTGRWPGPRIVEAPLGAALSEILALAPEAVKTVQGVLLGGYGGGWVTTSEALAMPLTEEAARSLGSSIGPGVVVLLPSDVCPLLETGRVVRYLAGERAGQCGPCVNGLDALSETMDLLAVRPRSLRGGVSSVPALCSLIEGRGACRHPDGAVRFAQSALRVFESHVALHLQRGPCHTTASPFLVVPSARQVAIR